MTILNVWTIRLVGVIPLQCVWIEAQFLRFLLNKRCKSRRRVPARSKRVVAIISVDSKVDRAVKLDHVRFVGRRKHAERDNREMSRRRKWAQVKFFHKLARRRMCTRHKRCVEDFGRARFRTAHAENARRRKILDCSTRAACFKGIVGFVFTHQQHTTHTTTTTSVATTIKPSFFFFFFFFFSWRVFGLLLPFLFLLWRAFVQAKLKITLEFANFAPPICAKGCGSKIRRGVWL